MTVHRRHHFSPTMPTNTAPLALFGIAEQPWMAAALCAQVDPEIFYVDQGESARPAKETCRRCPVIAECLDYALAVESRQGHRYSYGIFGGLTARERTDLLRGHVGTPCHSCGGPTPRAGRKYCDTCYRQARADTARRLQQRSAS